MARSASVGRGRWVALALAAGVVLVLDQLSKALVRALLELGEAVDVAGPFSLHHVRNSGIVGGHLQGNALPLAAFTALVVVGILIHFGRGAGGRPGQWAAHGLLLGGSLGNLVDRVRLGYVTDFLDRQNGGAFNVADVAILLGLLGILGLALAGGRSTQARARLDEAG
jgi:signal peptidase II